MSLKSKAICLRSKRCHLTAGINLKTSVFWMILIVFASQARILSAQDLTIDEILARASEIHEETKAKREARTFEFTEKTIAGKTDKQYNFEEVDTVISVVRLRGDDEISREVVYSSADEKDESKKKDDDGKVEERLEYEPTLSTDDPYYKYELFGESDRSYIIAVNPRDSKPKKGQVRGQYFIDKESFHVNKLEFTIPRPEKLKKIHMIMEFKRIEDGLNVPASMQVEGHVKALLGVINIRFKVISEFYDYKVIKEVEN
jgi:hypothetical protein